MQIKRAILESYRAKADKEVSDADIREKHVVLFGTPRENLLIAKIAGKLPVTFIDKGVELAGKAFTDAGVGRFLNYPNPLNPERHVLILPENTGDYASTLVLQCN